MGTPATHGNSQAPCGSRVGAPAPTGHLPPIQPPCRRHLAQGTTETHHQHRMLLGNGQWKKKTSTPWAGPLGGGVRGTGIFGSGWPLSTFLCTQPSPQPLPWLIMSLTFIFGDSWLLLFHLPVKGWFSPPWENFER